MARTAREEGFDEIADWFETLAKAERSHAGRFQRALDELNKPDALRASRRREEEARHVPPPGLYCRGGPLRSTAAQAAQRSAGRTWRRQSRSAVRHPLDWRSPDFYDDAKLDAEMRRVFDICHACRRCFNLCDSLPAPVRSDRRIEKRRARHASTARISSRSWTPARSATCAS